MEPDSHYLDREAIDREVEAKLAAAAAKRRAHVSESGDDLVAETQLKQTRAERDELQALLAISESERELALAEMRAVSDRVADLDRQLREVEARAVPSEPAGAEDEAAADLLVAAARAADDVRDASRARALRTLTKARDLAALVRAETELEQAALVAAQQRRAEIEGEVQEILLQAHATADDVVAGIAAERRAEAENEAAEILAQARADAESLVASIEEQRRRVREFLTSALLSLDGESDGSPENLLADLESRLHEPA